MAKIDEIRAEFPEFKGLDDEQVVNIIHRNYYPGADKSIIASNLGVKMAAPVAAEESGDVSRGFKTAMLQLPQTAGGAAALVGDAIGADGLRDYGMGVYQKNSDKIAAISKDSDSLTNVIEGDASAADWLQYAAGYTGGQALTAIATGGVGGMIGSQLAKRGIKEVVARGAQSAAAKQVAGKVAATGAKVGAGTALMGTNLMQEAGSIYPEAREQAASEGRELDGGDLARVGASAVGAAAVDTAMDAVMLGRVMKGGRKAGESMAGAAVREVPMAMGREAVTEGVQTGIERYGAGKELSTADAIREYVDSIGMGAVGGGLGGGASVLNKQKVPESGPLTRAANVGIDAGAGPIEYEKIEVPKVNGKELDLSLVNPDDIPYVESGSPDLGRLQGRVRELRAQGEDYTIISHDNGGYRMVPTAQLPKAAINAVQKLQPQDEVTSVSREEADANIKAFSDQSDPLSMDQAKNLIATPGAKGEGLMIVPHASGEGYTVLPSNMLSLDVQAEAMALQKAKDEVVADQPKKAEEKPVDPAAQPAAEAKIVGRYTKAEPAQALADRMAQEDAEHDYAVTEKKGEAFSWFHVMKTPKAKEAGNGSERKGADSTGAGTGNRAGAAVPVDAKAANPVSGVLAVDPENADVNAKPAKARKRKTTVKESLQVAAEGNSVVNESFTTRADANAAMLKAAETTGKVHEVVEQSDGTFTIEPIKENTDAQVQPANDGKAGAQAAAQMPRADQDGGKTDQKPDGQPGSEAGTGEPVAGDRETVLRAGDDGQRVPALKADTVTVYRGRQKGQTDKPATWWTTSRDLAEHFSKYTPKSGNKTVDTGEVIESVIDRAGVLNTKWHAYDIKTMQELSDVSGVEKSKFFDALKDSADPLDKNLAESGNMPWRTHVILERGPVQKVLREAGFTHIQAIEGKKGEEADTFLKLPEKADSQKVEKQAPASKKSKSLQTREAKVKDKAAAKDDGGGEVMGKASTPSPAAPFDQSLYDDIGQGKSSTDILTRIAAESDNALNREMAQALLDAGITPKITQETAEGKRFTVGNAPQGYMFAAAYSPKTDTVMLFQAADAERNAIHEFVHSGTFKALRKDGLHATQMKLLYKWVQKSGKAGDAYGMSNFDEFTAEALSNPEFQDMLSSITAMPAGSKFANAWNWFVDLVRRALGLPTKYANALDQALRYGRGLMLENGSQEQSKQDAVLGNVNRDTSTVGGAFDMLKDAKTMGDTTKALKSLAESDRKFNLWDRTVGTQFNKATKDADFKRVFDAYNQQTNDVAHYAIEAERQAPDVLQRLESVKDIGKALMNSGKRYKADLEAVSKALFANIEGKEGVQQKVYSDAELKAEFKLNDKQILMYKQARHAVNVSLDRLAQTTIASMGQSADMDIDALRNLDLASTAAAVKRHVGKDSAIVDRVDELVERVAELKRSGYMPAMRFGEYAVTVWDANKKGDPLHFEMFESQVAANIAANRLAKEFPGAKIDKSVMNKEMFSMFKGVSPETVELFAKYSGMDESDAYKEYIALAKSSRSSMQRMINRKGIAGFSEDVPRVLASFLTSNARQASMNMNMGEINAALASESLAKKGDVQREAQKLHEYMSNPLEEAQRLRGFMFMYFLGGSVASAAVNLTQPVLQTTPYLSQWAGRKVAGIMGKAAKMAATGKIDNAELKKAADRAAEEGITEPAELHQLMADASGSTLGSSLRARALTKAWGGFFALSESFNRRLTFLAAYQTAQGMTADELKKAGFDNAYDFAARAIIETQGLYAKQNRPNWARGPVGATLFTFRQFSISYIEFLNRLPNKQKALALGILVIAAGLQGLPFAEDIEDLIDTLGQSLGYNTNSKKALRDAVTTAFGEDLGSVLTYGLSAKSGIDLHGRLGTGNLLPGTGLFKMSQKDHGRDVAEFAGALGGVLTQFQTAMTKAQAGNLMGKTGALAAMAPVAVKNALQGAEMASTGEYRDTKGRKVQDVDLIDSLVKTLGFQPQEIAAESRRIQALQQDKGMMDAVKSAIAERWAAGVADNDREAIDKARETLRTWNEKNPDTPIRITPRSIQQRAREMKKTKAERYVKAQPKDRRQQVQEELG